MCQVLKSHCQNSFFFIGFKSVYFNFEKQNYLVELILSMVEGNPELSEVDPELVEGPRSYSKLN